MVTDIDRFSPLPLTAFKAVPGLLSATVLRDAPRTPESPRRHPENCSPTLRPEANLTRTVLIPPGLDGADDVNVSVTPQHGAENKNAQFDELLKSPFAATIPLVRDVLSSRPALHEGTHGETDLSRSYADHVEDRLPVSPRLESRIRQSMHAWRHLHRRRSC